MQSDDEYEKDLRRFRSESGMTKKLSPMKNKKIGSKIREDNDNNSSGQGRR